jgi:DNA polymerase
MAEECGTAGSADPRELLHRLTRALRLRLEGEARAGLAATARASDADVAGPARHAPGAAGAAAPEARAAETMAEELTNRVAAASPAAGAAGSDRQEVPSPIFVKGPELFDLHSPDMESGLTRQEALARIVAEVAECARCPELVANRTKTVPGQGSPYAQLVFVGEGPGQDEDLQGLAFVGRAGQLLTKMIESIAMTRDDVFIANIVKCRPPGNRQPTPDEAANCRPYLMRQIAVICPKVIVALGGVAAQNLLETHDRITRLRGRFYPFMGAKLMPTFHPAYVLRNYTPDVRKKVYDDLLKVRAELTA